MKHKRYMVLVGVMLCLCLLAGCGSSPQAAQRSTTFVLGDTTFNAENEEPDVNPHNAYSGWACIRYGIGETLFRYTDEMELAPWLASGYEQADENTWIITLRDGVRFSSGRAMDGQAVKECLEHLVQVHDRARVDLMVESITAQGQTVTVVTQAPNPTLLQRLCDPYACIIDLEAGVTEEGMVVGTGPYVATSLVSGEELQLVRNASYWDGEPGYERVIVRTITDGDTLTMALQAGDIDGAYGLPYASYPLFDTPDYTRSSCATSRAFFVTMNFESPLVQNPAVREAMAMGMDKQRFVDTLLDGNGYPASGPFPAFLSFGGDAVKGKEYDPQAARDTLERAGWVDTDGDGIREKDGQRLTIRWLTYPSRQELPLLAEAAQATLKDIGMEVVIQSTADHNRIRKDAAAWDVYASAMVTAPTGDGEYFFSTHCLSTSVANNGGYYNEKLERLAVQMAQTFDPQVRGQLAVKMSQQLLDDDAFIFCSHLQMSMVTRSDVTGLVAHPCDFYEITVDLAPAQGDGA